MLRRIILVASLFFVAVVLTVYLLTKGAGEAESRKGGVSVSSTDAQAATSGTVKIRTERISSGALQDMPLAMAIVEAEEAIANGVRPSDYAATLLELTVGLPPAPPLGVLGIAYRTRAEARIRRVMDRGASRTERRLLGKTAAAASAPAKSKSESSSKNESSSNSSSTGETSAA